MITQSQATAEQDGIVFEIAQACVTAIREAADNASPERFISLAVQQVERGGEFSNERITAYLHTTLRALIATSTEFQGQVCQHRHQETVRLNLKSNEQ